MPSRRRSRNKNLGNNLADVQRRLRFLERRPIRTKLSNRVVTKAAIAPSTVSKDEVDFGIVEIVPTGQTANEYAASIENPKDGQFLITSTGADAGASQVYSEETETYISVADPVASASADAAADAAAIAAAAAQVARTTADGKNKVFRQGSQPTTAQGPFAEGDLWFDTSNDNRISRYAGGSWGNLVELGSNAIASLSATKITAGSLAANVIVTSNITAGQISAGNIAAERMTAGVIDAIALNVNTISANKIGAGTINATIAINGPTITGGVIRTSAGNTPSTYNRVELSDTDEVRFYNENNTLVGRLGPFDFGGSINEGVVLTGGESYFTSPYLNLQSNNGAASAYLGVAGSYPYINMSVANTNDVEDTGAIIIAAGAATSLNGEIRLVSGPAGIRLESWTGSSSAAPDFIEFTNGGDLTLFADRVNAFGSLCIISDSVQQGTGAPALNEASGPGHIIFKYT